MLEVTGEDITALSDGDLRTLIGYLCEATLRAKDLPSSAVTFGGHQTAKDSGLDVRVALTHDSIVNGFLPRANTGFQVKKPKMPRAAILKEMKPRGTLRPVLLELLRTSGAYIIISGTDSTSDPELASRKAAMAETVRGVDRGERLFLDFYDRNRVVTWVHDHPNLVLWVRSRVGRSIQGWRDYATWSRTPTNTRSVYLADDAARIRTGNGDQAREMSATEGINAIRRELRVPGSTIRLVGLSGVGKTRLAAALFDPEVGVDRLNPDQVFYTDLADAPSPPPVAFLSNLTVAGTRAIVIVDNCPPDTHRQLADSLGSQPPMISLLTIEYDVTDDQPEGTEVFKLEPSSTELIERLVQSRFRGLSSVDCGTIAHFSGGNARIAVALAATIKKNESISGLNDATLLQRIVVQRNQPDTSLMTIAQACSLVYSFHGDTTSGEESELAALGVLVGKSAEEVYRAVSELRRRGQLQQRGPWRAVLPHAIANRLARTALQDIPHANILTTLLARPRLARSFSRRLAYLSDSQEAQGIVHSWLEPGGYLADVANLDELGRAMFANVAPVLPSATLAALERSFEHADEATLRQSSHFAPLLRSLAYEEDLFQRAVWLLVTFARFDLNERSDASLTAMVASLFQLHWSGTCAPLSLRLTVATGLLNSVDDARQCIGVAVVERMLKSNHFEARYPFEFGARSRTYGSQPTSQEEVHSWFSSVLKSTGSFALSNHRLANPVRMAIAREFRGLWEWVPHELDHLARTIREQGFWREGWIAARAARAFNDDAVASDSTPHLIALEDFLSPRDFIDRVRGLVSRSRDGRFDLDELEEVKDNDYEGAMMRAGTLAKNLGEEAIETDGVLQSLLPDLMAGGFRITQFGRGIASAATEPRAAWRIMAEYFSQTQIESVDLLVGFIAGLQERDEAIANELLDEAVADPTLSAWIPALQLSTRFDDTAIVRLQHVLARNAAPIERFRALAGSACDGLSGTAFNQLLTTIASKADGMPVALEILWMRLHTDRLNQRESATEVIGTGKALLNSYQFRRAATTLGHEDRILGSIIRASLRDTEGREIARRLCRDLVDRSARYEVSTYDYAAVVEALLSVHPFDVLDELFAGDRRAQIQSIRLLDDLGELRKSPMQSLDDAIMIEWCDRNPTNRYPLAAAIAVVFTPSGEGGAFRWTKLASELLSRAPDKRVVFDTIVERLRPHGWSGSLAATLATRLRLLERLDLTDHRELSSSAEAAKQALRRQIETERLRESREESHRNSRFE